MTDAERNAVLADVADAITAGRERLLDANAADLARMDKANPLYDRLRLTAERLDAISADMRNVTRLPSPLGHISHDRTLANGLHIRRVSVPFGVIGIVYEARPNVTFDVFALCFKSGNACVLKGGHDADNSNREGVALIHEVMRRHSIDTAAVTLLPSTHEATAKMLGAVGYIDLCIPRGGRKLIDFVRDTARIPVIETGAGVVNTYFDASADLDMGRRIVCNAKTRRVSVCNALDCLIVNSARMADLPALCEPLAGKDVTLYADARAYEALRGHYPDRLLLQATDDSYGTEFMDYKMAVRTADTLDEALDHIARYGSGHSECIITQSEEAAAEFRRRVDAACVYKFHRRGTVRARRRDWHKHTEARPARPHGPRRDYHLQVAH